MADCSKTDVFLEEWERMCDYYDGVCEECVCNSEKDTLVTFRYCAYSSSLEGSHKKHIYDIVKKWSDEHPLPKPKTYADVIFELFPKQTLEYTNPDWRRRICRVEFFGGICKHGDCEKCWLEPYPEEGAVDEN